MKCNQISNYRAQIPCALLLRLEFQYISINHCRQKTILSEVQLKLYWQIKTKQIVREMRYIKRIFFNSLKKLKWHIELVLYIKTNIEQYCFYHLILYLYNLFVRSLTLCSLWAINFIIIFLVLLLLSRFIILKHV